jgi:putative addiction module component (TIGR02574 family)
MTRTAGNLLEEALRLSDTERAQLAARLIESLDPEADDDAEMAWSLEIRQRLDDLEQGRVRTVPWSEARKLILEDRDESDAG